MKLVIDERIPFIRGILEPFADVLYLPGAGIRREQLIDADGMIIRTRTPCTRELLEGTPVRFIATATIGYDHIDTGWCDEAGIRWTNAPGCNSGSVAQYIAAALAVVATEKQINLEGKTLGIIGVGHVGSKVQRVGEALGMQVLLNDPPRARAEGPQSFTDLNTLLRQSDIVTLHIPLNRTGPDKTLHLVNDQFLDQLKPGVILINTARGEVLDEAAVLRWTADCRQPTAETPSVTRHASLVTGHRSLVTGHRSLVIDTWPHEPLINHQLLRNTWIATPHIAGYSLDGKQNATKMVVEAVAKHFGFTIYDLPFTGHRSLVTGHRSLVTGHRSLVTVFDHILSTYDILADDRRLRESPETFEEQRNKYPVRREFSAWRIKPFPSGKTGRTLQLLGFTP
jgi:erythronate-4-phosphate dehydrogenase